MDLDDGDEIRKTGFTEKIIPFYFLRSRRARLFYFVWKITLNTNTIKFQNYLFELIKKYKNMNKNDSTFQLQLEMKPNFYQPTIIQNSV